MFSVLYLNFVVIFLLGHGGFGRSHDENKTVLSRKRRYLIFPEGSSFQVVFDLTYPSVGMGNAFVFGNTAAMAWELPSTPSFRDEKYQNENETDPTTTQTPQSMDTDKEGQSWHAPLISYDNNRDSYVNPYQDYSKPSYFPFQERVFYQDSFDNTQERLWIKNVQDRYSRRSETNRINMPFQKTMFHHVHRRSRRELYGKIERFLDALARDGKTCILKAICLVNKEKHKGTMMQEIFKTIFRVKPHELYPDEDHYDQAANHERNCDEIYTQCQGHILSNLFKNNTF